MRSFRLCRAHGLSPLYPNKYYRQQTTKNSERRSQFVHYFDCWWSIHNILGCLDKCSINVLNSIGRIDTIDHNNYDGNVKRIQDIFYISRKKPWIIFSLIYWNYYQLHLCTNQFTTNNKKMFGISLAYKIR